MNNKPIIALFEENELNIAALYSLYAQLLPDNQSFWDRLSNEEISHAADLGNEKAHSDSIVENKFSRSIIKYVMDYVLEEIKKAQKNQITHKQALHAALRIEQSMLEKKCFEIFKPTQKSLSEVFCKMNKETEKHVEALNKEMKKNKFSF